MEPLHLAQAGVMARFYILMLSKHNERVLKALTSVKGKQENPFHPTEQLS